jgi:hypothetical protein
MDAMYCYDLRAGGAGRADAAAKLARALGSSDLRLVSGAAAALGNMGAAAETAAPKLQALLTGGRAEVRDSVKTALDRIRDVK